MKRILICLSCALLWSVPDALAADWRRVGWFRSDGRNVSVSDTLVRVVSAVDVARLNLKGADFAIDSAVIARFYPGWDYRNDLVIFYGPGAEGYRQIGFSYSTGDDRKALPGDTVPANLGVYDHAGTRVVKVPTALASVLGDTARVVAARSHNWDQDPDKEWLVVTAGTTVGTSTARPQSIRLYDRTSQGWVVERTVELRDPVQTGPLELRDVTGDGEPDFIYRSFLVTPGHFWVDAHVISRHAGFATVMLPTVFEPTGAVGPIR